MLKFAGFPSSTWRIATRHAVLSTLGAYYAWSGRYTSLMRRRRAQILLFHHVPPEHLKRFSRMLSDMARLVRFVSYSEIVTRLGANRVDEPLFAVSFDDGLASCLEPARVLHGLGISTCFFVCPSIVGETDPQRIEFFCKNRAHTGVQPFLSWTDLESLRQMGHEIGSHTMTHLNLGQTQGSELEYEINQSAAILRQRLGQADHFAWPFGQFAHFTPQAAALVVQAGYKSCASGVRGCHLPAAAAQENFLCLRRDQIRTCWPPGHIRYFLAHNATRPIRTNQTWPPTWNLSLPADRN